MGSVPERGRDTSRERSTGRWNRRLNYKSRDAAASIGALMTVLLILYLPILVIARGAPRRSMMR